MSDGADRRRLSSDEAPNGAVVLASATRLKQCGCVHAGWLGGWALDRRTGAALLVTVAHILAPRRDVFARAAGAPPLSPVLETDGPWLRTALDPAPVARVLRIGVFDPRRRVSSLDVAIAQPVLSESVPRAAVASRLAAPRVGQRVAIPGAPAGAGIGQVVRVGWNSGHYGARDDVLVASLDDEPFSRAGMSGAWVVEADTGWPVGMLVGEVEGVPMAGRPGGRLACLHPLAQILARFDLALASP